MSNFADLRQRRGRPAELPGVHRHDEGPDTQGPQVLQQAGGMGRVQAVHQKGDEGVGMR